MNVCYNSQSNYDKELYIIDFAVPRKRSNELEGFQRCAFGAVKFEEF